MKKTSQTLVHTTLALILPFALSSCALFKKKGASGGAGGSDGDYVNGTPLADRQEGVSFMSDNVDKKKFSPVHFAFDSYSVESSDEGKLDEVATFLQGNSNTIIIAGFTDERGTPEYNRGLGERRAGAVREYLIHHGASADKIQTVSFGAEMPADSGSNDSAWARNRRAEFGVVK
ncbi:MAG: peptidoglycan-associated lipoprotein [Chthoniobacter sp.]|jgi:peptidoglycan-associated lipoprotein|nr:peptidoglycan-associated lipoprotein [Chthoniobacter sp.]